MAAAQPSFAEWVCLSLIAQQPVHGWALGSELAADGEIGRIWSLSRALTYRAIDGLVDKRLITRSGAATARGRDRVMLTATPSGRRRARTWLDTPVEHVRDVRTELLVKLVLRNRVGLDNADLLVAQRDRLEPALAALIGHDPAGDAVALWRRESARATQRFLDLALAAADRPRSPEHRPGLRKQLRASRRELGLAPGDPIVVVITPGEVIVAQVDDDTGTT